MMLWLPDELVDAILVHGGPLSMARDRRVVAARRIERAWVAHARSTRWRDGTRVRFRFPRETEWTTGTIHGTAPSSQRLVARRGARVHTLYLPNRRVRIVAKD